jgi:signal transduction histidine kinase
MHCVTIVDRDLRGGRYSAQYPFPFSGPELLMTLRRLRMIGIVAPVLAVIALEITRALVLGSISLRQRLIMDAVGIAAIIFYSSVIFRFVGRMQGRLLRQNEELLALHSAGLDVASDLSLDVVLKKVVEQAKRLADARYGAVSVVDDTGRILSFITAGITAEERAKIDGPPVGHGLLGVVLHEGQTLNLQDLTAHPQSHGFAPNHPAMHSLLAVPIPCKGPFVGNLYLTEKIGADRFSKEDEETLNRFAVQAALAIDNAHLHAQVADLAIAQERIRISHEMHDGLAQVLAYVNTKVQAAEAYLKRGKSDEAGVQLRELSTAARQAYHDVREAIIGLRTLPSAEQTMGEVLREYTERWQEMSGVATSLLVDSDLRLRTTVELQVVRIVQEALTNVRKHARATHARVEVRRRNGAVVASVTDDGVGFDPAALARGEFPQYGLMTMKERAAGVGGTVTVESLPGRGTTVKFELPFVDAVEP